MSISISLVTQTNFGPWNIPARGQNFINTHYGKNNSIEITNVVSEGIMFDNFKILENFIKDNNDKKIIIIFCSLMQLSNINENIKEEFIKFFSNYEIHFALELTKGKGKEYLTKIINEAKTFSKYPKIKYDFKNYTEFFKKYKPIF